MGHNVKISGSQVNSFFALLMRFNTPWNPLNWAGRGLVDLGEGRWLSGLFMVIAHPGALDGRFHGRPGHCRTLVLHRLGRDAGGGQ